MGLLLEKKSQPEILLRRSVNFFGQGIDACRRLKEGCQSLLTIKERNMRESGQVWERTQLL
jgi:hypothetical protein